MKTQLVVVVALISLNACVDDRELGFIKIGTYTGKDEGGNSYQKSFYVSRDYKVNWIVSRTVCLSFGMELARLETHEEFDAVQGMVMQFSSAFEQHTHVDGTTLTPGSITEWFFANGKKHPQPIKWNAGEPNVGNNDRCMNIVKGSNGISYNDLPCSVNANKDYENLKFICQQYDSA